MHRLVIPKTAILVSTLLLSAFLGIAGLADAATAQVQSRVKLRMVLILPDLTLRPVPRHAVEIVPVADPAAPQADPIRVTTGFDGTAEISLPVGSYRVVVPEAVTFEGQRYTWDLPLSVPSGQTDVAVDLSNDNATLNTMEMKSAPLTAEGQLFKNYKSGVVTVESEMGHGSGFVVDSSGLLLTNAHVVEGSRDVAIDFDVRHRFVAEPLAIDSENDIAVLRFNPAAYPEARPLTLALSPGAQPTREGDPVIAIGSPLNQEKILTRGIVSKVEEHVIISDVNINHGNSGGPLLNSAGEVIGITTFKDLDPTGGGISGIVRIGLAESLLKRAQAEAALKPLPDAQPLPSMPEMRFPLPELKAQIQGKEFDPDDYGARTATFDVQFMTPPLKYYLETKDAAEKSDIRLKKQKKAGVSSEDPDSNPYSNLRAWRAYLGEYRPVVEVYVLPRLKATGGSIFGAMMTGVASVLKYRYKSDFDEAELIVDGKTITPIRRSRFTREAKFVSQAGYANDVCYAGVYTFGTDFLTDLRPDSVVSLVIHDGLRPERPILIEIDSALLRNVRDDLGPVTGHPTKPPEQRESAVPSTED